MVKPVGIIQSNTQSPIMNGTYFCIFLIAISLPLAYLTAVHCWLDAEWHKVKDHDGEI